MSPFDASTYGQSFADVYDEWYSDLPSAQATADFVDGFGSEQAILELGTGTGRLARTLTAADHMVVGIDASSAMLSRFDAHPAVPVAADMSRLPFAPASFDTVLVATNTLFNVASPEGQRATFAEARRCLRLGGRLIVEVFVPAAPDPALDRLVTTRSLEADEVVLTATIRDSQNKVVTGQHIQIRESGIRLRPWRIRYSEPEELDGFSVAAGFRLGARWADWTRSPFGPDSEHHVSVYVAV